MFWNKKEELSSVKCKCSGLVACNDCGAMVEKPKVVRVFWEYCEENSLLYCGRCAKPYDRIYKFINLPYKYNKTIPETVIEVDINGVEIKTKEKTK